MLVILQQIMEAELMYRGLVHRVKLLTGIISLLLLLFFEGITATSAEDIQFVELVITNPQGQQYHYSAELAHTADLRRIGLMNRQAFEAEQAMLFIWPETARRLFWMKNTLLPLDILFFSESGELFHLVHMAEPFSETLHSSIDPTAAVIELKGGEAKRLKIDIGSKLTFKTVLPDAQ